MIRAWEINKKQQPSGAGAISRFGEKPMSGHLKPTAAGKMASIAGPTRSDSPADAGRVEGEVSE